MQFLINPKTTVSFVEGQLRNEKLKIKNYFRQSTKASIKPGISCNSILKYLIEGIFFCLLVYFH